MTSTRIGNDPEAQALAADAAPPSGTAARVAVLTGLVLVVLVGLAIVPRLKARADVRTESKELGLQTVSVIHPKRGASAQEVVLPANIQAYTDAPIFARTGGYLRRWYVDIGARVTEGQLLAEIETPEVDAQLRQARADLNTAEANLQLSQITASRYEGLLKTNAVSQQDADNASGDFQAKKAIVQSAESNVKRLESLHSFQRIYAPFDGVITARNTDIGALIDPGSGTQRELFHIAAVHKLRVYVSVPQTYYRVAKPGLKVELSIAEYPGRRFEGTLVETANAIDASSRTLLAEIAVDNAGGELLPGAFAQAHLSLGSEQAPLLVPVSALIFHSAKLQVGTLDDTHHAALKEVSLGRDFGNEVEITSGLSPDDAVIVDPPDSLVAGQELRVAGKKATS
jgi:RND family efflux transporter MFP subunit